MHSRLFIAITLVFLLAGCKDEAGKPRHSHESLEPGADHPLGKKLEELRAPVRLRPDRRFTLAVARVRALLTGKPGGVTDSRFENGRWTILHDREKIGDLPVYPDFDDALSLLRAWSEKQLSEKPLGEGAAAPKASPEVFPVESAQARLRVLDEAWQKEKSKKLLRPAARASVALVFQMRDELQVSDEVAAHALALVALAGAAGPETLVREEAMLAEAMGYTRAAKKRAEKLGPEDPLRAYVNRDDVKLQRLYQEKGPVVETGYLWQRRVAQLKDYEKEKEVRRAVFGDGQLSLTPLGAHLDIDFYWKTRLIDRALALIVSNRIAYQSSNQPGSEAELIKILSQATDELSGPPVRRLSKLESFLRRAGGSRAPSLYDAGINRAFYRAFAYTGLYRTACFYIEVKSSRGEAADVWKQWTEASTALGGELREWYSVWMSARWVDADPKRVAKALAWFKQLGVPARMDLLKHIIDNSSWGNPILSKAAGQVLSALDSRVEHRLNLATIANRALCNMVLLRRALESAVRAAPDRHYWMEAWHAWLSADARRLEELVEAPGVSPYTRSKCLVYLKEIEALATDQLLERFEALSKQYPEEWDVQQEYIEQLKDAKKYEKGREVAKAWLSLDVQDPGLDYQQAISQIGGLYRREGKHQEGLEFLKPHKESQYGGLMATRALLLAGAGKHKEAEAQVRARIERYPSDHYNVGLLARVLWLAGRHGDAARMLKNPPVPLRHVDWRWIIGKEFCDLYRDRPAEEGMQAVEALKSVGIGHTEIMELAAETYNKTNHELAFSIYSGLDPKPWDKVLVFVRAYKRLKKVLGEKEALDWLASQIPEHWRERLSILAYNEEAFDLLWTLVPGPDREDDKADFVWLMRAAASRIHAPTPKQKEILEDRYEDPGDKSRHYHQYGRFLLGYIPFDHLLKLATAPDKLIEIAYYVGLKAQSEGRLDEASDWYQVAFSLGDEKEAEYRWAYNQLNEWRNAAKYLPRSTK